MMSFLKFASTVFLAIVLTPAVLNVVDSFRLFADLSGWVGFTIAAATLIFFQWALYGR